MDVKKSCSEPGCVRDAAVSFDDKPTCDRHAIERISIAQAKIAEVVNARFAKLEGRSYFGALGFFGLLIAIFFLTMVPLFVGAMWALVVLGYRWTLLLSPESLL